MIESLSKENRFYFMGIAILAIILHHLCYRLDVAWHLDTFPFTPFIHGSFGGVDLFFFASAYGCCASWEHHNWIQYYGNRIRRIYPQYLLFLIIVLAFFYPGTSLLHNAKVVVLCLTGLAPINLFHTRIEWFIPSLLLTYFTLPILKMILSVKGKWRIIIMVLGLILSWKLLKYDLLYWSFQTRIPVIMCGVFAYLNRNRKGYCIKVFSLMLLIAYCTREETMIYSMIVPLLMVSLSFADLSNVPAKRMFSWLGKHSLEIFFAQTITTQFIMHRYYWGDKWLSLCIVVGLTVALFFVFWGFQSFISQIEKTYSK